MLLYLGSNPRPVDSSTYPISSSNFDNVFTSGFETAPDSLRVNRKDFSRGEKWCKKMSTTKMNQELFSILIQVIAACGFAGMILVLSVLFGKRASHRAPADVQYECGVVPIGTGAPMFSVKYYIVAMLFLVFDIEVIFLYPWSVNFQDVVANNSEAFISMAIFLGVLVVAYLYAWGKGALVWHREPVVKR